MAKLFKKTYIHVGLPKTGSSYLQSAFEMLEEKRGFNHTTYPVPHPHHDFQTIKSGNGLDIAKLLATSLTPDFSEGELTESFENLLSHRSERGGNLLISSEWFSAACQERFTVFREKLLTVCDEIEIILFIKPLAPMAWSMYNQEVKRNNLSDSFHAWAETNLARALNRWTDNIFGFNIPITALPFSSTNLLTSFLHELSESGDIAKLVPNEVVNRSLTPLEQNMLKLINKSFNNPSLAEAISNSFIKTSPSSTPALLSKEDAKQAELYLPDILNSLDKYKLDTSTKIKDILKGHYEIGPHTENPYYDKDETHMNLEQVFTVLAKQDPPENEQLNNVSEYSTKIKSGLRNILTLLQRNPEK